MQNRLEPGAVEAPDRAPRAGMPVVVAAFYKFVPIEDPDCLRQALAALCDAAGIKGTILIAREGINGTVSGTERAIADLLDALRADARFADIDVKLSRAASHPFQRTKIKVKPELVTFGVPSTGGATGKRVAPEEWNDLVSDPSVIVIDTRNDYEFAIGTFENAINPGTNNFSDFAKFAESELAQLKNRKIAMFCTGGIRCEKASAHLISLGFEDVSQLDGGILKYLERVPRDESRWRGECFVFDQRVALGHGVAEGSHRLCLDCGFPIRSFDGVARRCARCAA